MDTGKNPTDFQQRYNYTAKEWTACLKVLRTLKDDPFNNPDNEHLSGLVTKIYKKATKETRRARREENKTRALEVIKRSKLARNARQQTSFYGQEEEDHQQAYTKVEQFRNCYVCNRSYNEIHSFYHRLCPACAKTNFQWRNRTANLINRRVIITGGRVKVGYATALKFLRANAHVTVTTRFPALAYKQYTEEKDFSEFKDRLTIVGLDLRNLAAVNTFVNQYKLKNERLDILINNAAQTIKYDEHYYAPLVVAEQQYKKQAVRGGITTNPTPVLETSQGLFRQGVQKLMPKLTRFGLPVDDREKTSWNSRLGEIGLEELLEVNLINHISPYLLIEGLTPLMRETKSGNRYIINVTSSEGQFSYGNKTIFHPHTNMTKAALNMLTRTSGKEYKEYGITMCAVDVGWISTGATEKLREKQFSEGYIPPLDSVDGAARIFHPIIRHREEFGSKAQLSGRLLKNYAIAEW